MFFTMLFISKLLIIIIFHILYYCEFYLLQVPHWYHYACFFGKFKASAETDFAHFNSLRWDDQEIIRGKINGTGSGKSKKKGKSAQNLDVTDSAPTAAFEFSIEYAKSARAKCRQCEEKIEKVHNDIVFIRSTILILRLY